MAIITYNSGREAEEYIEKEGYEKSWQGFIKRLECWAFIEKPRMYFSNENQLIPLAEISSPVNLESKADDATKDKKHFSHFSSARFQKTKTEKMRENRNIFPRKII